MKRTISILVLIAMMLASVLAILPAAAEGETSLVKDYATAADGDVLYTFNFNGDDVFTPDKMGADDNMDYIISTDGSSVTIEPKADAESKKQNIWGGEVAGLEATLQHVYSFRYKVRANSEGVTDATKAKNNSVGIGAWLAKDGYKYNSAPPFYNNYSNHNTFATVDGAVDLSMRRSSISIGNAKYGDGNVPADKTYPEYIYWEKGETAFTAEYLIDAEGFVDMLMVYNGPTQIMSTYILDVDGNWIFIESVEELKHEGNMGFFTYAYYTDVNTTIKDAKIYKGDFANFVPPLVKDYDSAALGDVLYTFNFNGDEAFTPAKLNASADEMEYIVSDDGKTVTIKAKEGAKDQSINLWGGEVEGLVASLDRTYSFRYKARSNSEGYSSSAAKNNSVGIGGWGVDLTIDKPEFYNHYGNHTTSDVDGKIDMRRSVLSWGGNSSKLADYVMWEDTLNAYAVDPDGFMDVLVVFDGPTKMITAYVLDQAGVWQIIQQVEKLEKAGNICFASYAYYNTVNTTITDVRVYKGDFTTYVPDSVEEATEEEIETLKLFIAEAEVLTEENFTEGSWAKLTRALDRAKAICDAEVKPKAEVESRTLALMNALSSLEADLAPLNTLITECRKISKDNYTADSWATFEAALNAAKANESTKYEDVKGVYDALVAARDALVVAPADKTELADLLARAALLKEEDFAAEDWATYAEALAEVKAVFESETATVTEVAAAVKDLTKAIKAINGGVIPELPEEKPTEEPTEEPTEQPTEKPTEQPTEKPTEQATATEPTTNEGGCGGIIGASAVVVAVVLGAVVLKKKED